MQGNSQSGLPPDMGGNADGNKEGDQSGKDVSSPQPCRTYALLTVL
jgi:hypothetical protein